MLETRAIVVHADKSTTLVKVNQASGCEQCNGKGCGSGKLAQLFCSKPRQFQVQNAIDAKVGDDVIVSIAEGAVLRGISLVYMLPLSLLMAGVILASLIPAGDQQDIYIAAGAIAGLSCGLLLVKWITAQRNDDQTQPYITRLWHEEWSN
jgi:sigma-E factor negative regulatory protein RseC